MLILLTYYRYGIIIGAFRKLRTPWPGGRLAEHRSQPNGETYMFGNRFCPTAFEGHVLLRAALLAAIAIACFVASDASEGEPVTTTVNVTIQPTATALPVVVADRQGMFAKHGVEGKWSVSHVPISDSINSLGRQYDVMMGTQPALIAAAGQGIPIVAVTGGALDTAQVP